MSYDGEHDGLRDLLDTLRAEYRESGEADDLPPESLEDCDAGTREAARWVQRAWALESASDAESGVTVPLALARAASSRRDRDGGSRVRRVAGGLALAAAAAAAAAVAIVLLRHSESTPAEPTDTPIAHVVPTPGDSSPESAAARRDFGPGSFRSRDDGVELVSGSVRIVLLHSDN